MREQKLTNDTVAFIFDDVPDFYTCVFLIEKKSRIFLLDTFAGSESMRHIQDRLSALDSAKELIVVNSHFHWDHVWGNIAFKNCTIIGHKFCREDLENNWKDQIKNRGKYIAGKIEPIFPSLTFDSRLNYPDDQIAIFHSPGHTRDSISLFDRETSELYVFDNLENPIIYVEDPDLDQYISTLEYYLALSPKRIFASHTVELGTKDIEKTIEYLRNLKNGVHQDFSSDYEKRIHRQNMSTISSYLQSGRL